MTLIRSISGIRGTIGGKAGEGLNPHDVVTYTSAYAEYIKKRNKGRCTIVVGRDARLSGDMINRLVCGTLMSAGMDVTDIGLSTTPTVEMAVLETASQGGIIITASHNPKQWNALKLLNANGEFLIPSEIAEVLETADKGECTSEAVDKLGMYHASDGFIDMHIKKILELPLVNTEAIRKAEFRITIDCVNSTGGIAIPRLLMALGVKTIDEMYCEPSGRFPHNPEPLPENISELSAAVVKNKADLGFVVDPDVDRLAIVCEDGEMFGEEYTLVSVADYILKNKQGNTVSNLSSTSALRDITIKAGGSYFTSAVGEINVIEVMKKENAVIGGEGNGGIIYPDLHYGRDALVGIALFLSHLALSGKSCSSLRATYPNYYMSKNKIEVNATTSIDSIMEQIKEKYKRQPINTIDGLRIDFDREWVHLRKSNTEPIIRIYSESDSMAKAETLARKMVSDIREIIKLQPED